MKLIDQPIARFRTLALLGGTASLCMLTAHAAPLPSGVAEDHRTKNHFQDTDLGQPISRTGGGGRTSYDMGQSESTCLNQLIALEPGQDDLLSQSPTQEERCQQISRVNVAHTQSAQPFVWVYIPDYAIPGLVSELTLIDEQRRVETWEVPLPETAGVMCFQIPYDLEPDNVYAWSLSVPLTDSEAANPTVGGLLAYTPMDEADPWKDTLTSTGQHLIDNPNPAMVETWKELLRSQGLAVIADILPSQRCQSLN